MAAKYDQEVIVHYGPSGHGKGLVDAMSAFGVKGPLMKAILATKFKYSSSKDILLYLFNLFENDVQKYYFDIPPEDIMSLHSDGGKPVKFLVV